MRMMIPRKYRDEYNEVRTRALSTSYEDMFRKEAGTAIISTLLEEQGETTERQAVVPMPSSGAMGERGCETKAPECGPKK